MKYILPFFFLCALSLYQINAEPLKYQEVHFLPANFYVGDLVEIRISLLEIPNDFYFDPVLYRKTSSLFWEIKNISYDIPSQKITISFISFAIGRQILPPINVSKNYTIEGLSISTLSLASETSEIQSLKKPLLASGTEISFFIIVLISLIVPIFLVRIFGKIIDFFKKQKKLFFYKKPYKWFISEIKFCRKLISDPSAYHFFSRTNKSLRVYLTHRLSENFDTLTTQELKVFLKNKNYFDFQETEILIDFFRLTDFVKFADYEVDNKTREAFLEDITKICQKFEKQRRESVNF